ncbi:MAG: hypothetical protein R2812_06670 [Gelidibacter sp.]
MITYSYHYSLDISSSNGTYTFTFTQGLETKSLLSIEHPVAIKPLKFLLTIPEQNVSMSSVSDYNVYLMTPYQIFSDSNYTLKVS